MPRLVLPLLAATGLLASPAPAVAGAFNRAPGEGLIIRQMGFSEFGHFVDARGRSRRQPKAGKFEASAYVEYGLNDWLMALVRPGLVTLSDEAQPLPATSGGAALGLQAQVWRRGDTAAALQASLRFSHGDTGPQGTGEERAGLELRALAGRNVSIAGRKLYLEGQAALRFRRDEGREALIDATLIAPLFGRTALHAHIASRFFSGAGRRPGGASHKVGLALAQGFGARWTITLGGFMTFHVREARHETGGVLALWRRF